MGLWLASAVLIAGAFAALLLHQWKRASTVAGCGGAVLALAICAGWAVMAFDGSVFPYQLPVVVTGIAAALFAPAYLKGHGGERGHWFWFFFDLTLASMLAVIGIRRGLLPFLVAWEMMGLCSFGLVVFERGKESVRRAGWGYLVACEAGALALMLAATAEISPLPSETRYLLMPYLLLVGFGLKAGFPLLHTWLPEAHPAAPAPVSAVMSGAMIVLGFCGFFRFLPANSNLGTLGWVLLILGAAGAFGGILCGAAQNDLKRLLAYSSVENVGIITLGFALALLTGVQKAYVPMILAWTGALLHVINHALLKSSLFLGAGAVLKCTGTLKIDLLGGLQRKMPWIARCFTLQSCGICGLPPFAGFAGELLIYAAAFHCLTGGTLPLRLAGVTVLLTLALTGAAAGVAFAKAAGAVFLGEPRTSASGEAAPESRGLVLPVAGLTLLSLLLPFVLPFFVFWVQPVVTAAELLFGYALAALALYFLILLVWLLRRIVSGAHWRTTGTWDCGYARPTARMSYTGSAFVQPLADLFNPFLKQKKRLTPPSGLFPEKAGFDVSTDDPAVRTLWHPAGRLLQRVADRVHRLQSGYLHLYVLVMVLALAAMLVWSCWYGEGR